MLYLIHRANHPELSYRGGQGPIVHLKADLHQVIAWARSQNRRWAFTLSNAASFYFEDRCDLSDLDQIDWNAIQARAWVHCKEEKQAEFLLEYDFPWMLVSSIGVLSLPIYNQVNAVLQAASHQPPVAIKRDWYY